MREAHIYNENIKNRRKKTESGCHLSTAGYLPPIALGRCTWENITATAAVWNAVQHYI